MSTMDATLSHLRQLILRQNQTPQRATLKIITKLLTDSKTCERRNGLSQELCQGNALNILNEGITSNFSTLLPTLNLICIICEKSDSCRDICLILQSVGRVLIFLARGKDFAEQQPKLVEVLLMVEILLKRLINLASELTTEYFESITSLVAVCELLLKNKKSSNNSKISLILIFRQILTILSKSTVNSETLKTNNSKFVYKIIQILSILIKFCFEVIYTKSNILAIFLVTDLLVRVTRLKLIDPILQIKLNNVLNRTFRKHLWQNLFEDVQAISLADYMITCFNEILSKYEACNFFMLTEISKSCLIHNGIESIVVFLKDIHSTQQILATKIKFLLSKLISSIVLEKIDAANKYEITSSILKENIEEFSDLLHLSRHVLWKNSSSFIFLFYVISKYCHRNNCELLQIILRKTCSILKSWQRNQEIPSPGLFWTALSIYQNCRKLLTKQLSTLEQRPKLFSKSNEHFQTLFNKDTFKDTSIATNDHWKWLKKYKPITFDRAVSTHLNHEISWSSLRELAKLLTPIKILHLINSNCYSQMMNASKILSVMELRGDDIEFLQNIQQNITYESEQKLLCLIFVYRSNVNKFEDANAKRFLTIVTESFLGRQSESFQNFSIELKVFLIETTIQVIILKCQQNYDDNKYPMDKTR